MTRIRANLAALTTLRTVQAENRPATPGEQTVLARWSGWGAVPAVFDADRADLAWARDQLSSLLSEQEMAAASRNTLNAHYTDAAIVQAIWDGVRGLGFTGGDVLEPGCGSGNFIAFAPEAARVTGVELDPVTAGIAAALYPDARIQCESLADTRLPDDFFDLTVGNVPFAPSRDVRLTDRRHNPGRQHSLHNHFIIASLHMTRPGGLVAVLTSRYTMDAQNPAARRQIAEMADLAGAVRLPTGAQQRAAGTTVVMDLLIFRRREPGAPAGPAAWEQSRSTEIDGIAIPVNAHFLDHPAMVLGEPHCVHGPYREGDLTVRGTGDTAAALREALEQIAREAAAAGLAWTPAPQQRAAAAVLPAAGQAGRPDGYLRADRDGSFTQLAGGLEQPFPVPAKQRAELRHLLRLRDTVLALLDAEGASTDDTPQLDELRRDLNLRYDSYVRAYGPVSRFSWRRTGRTDPETGEEKRARVRPPQGGFRTDPYAPAVLALEEFDPVSQRAGKAAIFTRRVVAPRSPRLGADSPADALAICLDLCGEVRLPAIARLLGVSEDQARADLGALVYEIPPGPGGQADDLMEHVAADLPALSGFSLTGADITGSASPPPPDPFEAAPGTLVPAAEYLSGNVRRKLATAEAAARDDPRFAVNAAALREVIPADLGPAEIVAQLGAAWIDASYVQQFLRELLDDDSVQVNQAGGAVWAVKGPQHGVLATSTWGTGRYSAPHLVHALLEQRKVQVRDMVEMPDGSKRSVLNPDETLAAQEKAAQLSERFSEWVWEDPDRAEHLAGVYNEMFNALVLRTYDDAQLSLPGLALSFEPHPHQVAAVARIINEPAVGLFHEVGAGKTAEMVMGAMELRRLGLARKPAIVVPNHMLEQFSREFLQLYPQAQILVAQKEDLQAERRRLFIGRCATGEWDAVIISHSAFERIPLSAEAQQAYMDLELDRIRAWIQKAKETAETPLSVKRLEGMLLAAEEKLKAKLDSARDPGVTFEATGIDYLFIDEAHLFKNLRTMSNIPGAAIDGSMRASDLDMKIHHLRERNGQRVVTFATATPIANSVTEAQVMMRYLRPDLLDDAGVKDFDSWAATFGQTVTEIELAPEGGSSFRQATRFAKFRNVAEMLRMFHVAADIKTAEDLKLPVPAITTRADGKRLPETVPVEPSGGQEDFIGELGKRADKIRSGSVTPEEDNMVTVCTDGRQAALDLRLVGRDMDVPGKIGVAADRITAIWDEHRGDVYTGPDGQPHPVRGSLQIVFCDMGTPKPGFNVYDELRSQLTARGLPRQSVRFIHEAKTDQQKGELFAACRAGNVAVLIGTTAKMGVGTNVQTRAIALHHLDAPWRPADVAQREGRILRQGNQNAEVQILRYVTERSFDGYMWQTLERKAKFISQVMRGRLDVREIEDIGDAALSYNEVKALATGNPLLIDKAEADAELTRLERAERAHQRNQGFLQHTITRSTQRAAELTGLIEPADDAIARRRDTRGDAFTMKVDGQTHTKRAPAGKQLKHLLLRESGASPVPGQTRRIQAGELGGFPVVADVRSVLGTTEITTHLDGAPGTGLRLSRGELTKADPGGLVTKLENRLRGLEEFKTGTLAEIDRLTSEAERATSELGSEFPQAGKLSEARDRVRQITGELQAMAAESESRAATDEAAPDPDDQAEPAPATTSPVSPPQTTSGQQQGGTGAGADSRPSGQPARSPRGSPAEAGTGSGDQPAAGHRQADGTPAGRKPAAGHPSGAPASPPEAGRDLTAGSGDTGPGQDAWTSTHPHAPEIEAMRQAALADSRLAEVARANGEAHFGLVFAEWADDHVAGLALDPDPGGSAGTPAFAAAFFDDLDFRARLTATLRHQVHHALRDTPADISPAETAARSAGTAAIITGGLTAAAPAAAQDQAAPGAPQADPAEPEPAARLIIEHATTGTVVRGSDRTDTQLHGFLKDAGFKFSRRQNFWYLPRTWTPDTRDRRVRRLTAALERAGRQFTLTGQPEAGPGPAAPLAPIEPGPTGSIVAGSDAPGSNSDRAHGRSREAATVLAQAEDTRRSRDRDRTPIDYDAMKVMIRRQRAALTRAINSGDPDQVVLAVRDAVHEWNQPGAAWPDDWSRWQRAFDDAVPPQQRADIADLPPTPLPGSAPPATGPAVSADAPDRPGQAMLTPEDESAPAAAAGEQQALPGTGQPDGALPLWGPADSDQASADDAAGASPGPPGAGQQGGTDQAAGPGRDDASTGAISAEEAGWRHTAHHLTQLPSTQIPRAVAGLEDDELAEVRDILGFHFPPYLDLGPCAEAAYDACTAELDSRHGQGETPDRGTPHQAAAALPPAAGPPGETVPAHDAAATQTRPGPDISTAASRPGEVDAPSPGGTIQQPGPHPASAGPDTPPGREHDPEPAGPEVLAGIRATTVTRQIVALALRGGLRPRLDGDGPRKGTHRIIVNGEGRDALFGAIYIGSATGKVLRAVLTHGNNGTERAYDGVAAVRDVLTAWATLRGQAEATGDRADHAQVPPPDGAETTAGPAPDAPAAPRPGTPQQTEPAPTDRTPAAAPRTRQSGTEAAPDSQAAPEPGLPAGQGQAIIDAALQGSSVAVSTGAGDSMATVAEVAHALAARSPGTSIVYITTGTDFATRGQLPPGATITEMYAAAKQALAPRYGAKISTGGKGARTPRTWAKILGIPGETPTSAGPADAVTVAELVMYALGEFRDSGDVSPGIRHLPPTAARYPDVADLALRYTRAAWNNIASTANAAGLTGRGATALLVTPADWLKIWALTRPQLGADVILFPETPDTRGVIRQIVLGQQAQVIAAGDSHPWAEYAEAARTRGRLHPGAPGWVTFTGAVAADPGPGTGQAATSRSPGDTPDGMQAAADPGRPEAAGAGLVTGPIPDAASPAPARTEPSAAHPGQADAGAEAVQERQAPAQPPGGGPAACSPGKQNRCALGTRLRLPARDSALAATRTSHQTPMRTPALPPPACAQPGKTTSQRERRDLKHPPRGRGKEAAQ